MTNKVNIEEKPKPHTIAVAIGPQIRESPATPAAKENKPAMVVKVVIKMGITRRLEANTIL